MTRNNFLSLFIMGVTLLASNKILAQKNPVGDTMDVGVARIDITPDGPIRLTGYGARKKTESEGVIHRLEAKALAFGSDEQGPSIFITVDLLGIPATITKKLVDQLSKSVGIEHAQLVICASHTHGGPELGNTLNILQYRGETFSDSLLAVSELVKIAQYTETLSQKLEAVALAALKGRKPSFVTWGQGQAEFAKNRRAQGGPVDHALPLMKITGVTGELRAVLVNYACHGTTLHGDVNKVHGDWIGEAQKMIEANHPGTVAMIAIGCGADSNPDPRGKMEHVGLHAGEISANVEKLLTAPLQPLSSPPVGRIKWVKLPFASVPTVPELINQTADRSAKGYYARIALDRLMRGEVIPPELDYPVQTWTFGDGLAMINLAGEVVVDYAVRLKNTLGADKLWINAYANDAPCYIASRRVIREGGYEAESSMYYYDKPSPFVEDIEETIIAAVHDLLPGGYTAARDSINRPTEIVVEGNVTDLPAADARSVGPEIKYMPEWKAFGWFTESDRVEWDLKAEEKGIYDVYMEWSVSDKEAGKPFVFEAGKQQLKGNVGKSGSWFTYKKVKLGRLRLPAGSHKVVFRPAANSPKGALLDLRAITLVLVK